MVKNILLIFLSLFLISCSQTYVNRMPVGETFPEIKGEALDKNIHQLPEYFKNRPVILLLGYKQNSQFDIDRWLVGLDMTKTAAEVFELPTIQGWAPRQIKGFINEGMRKGIPEELWSIVITVYKDGDTLQKFTGNQNPNNARVILLNQTGQVSYFYDRGFSVTALNEIRKALLQLQS